jgi:general secretion pathway protein D
MLPAALALLQARTPAGDRYLAEGRNFEQNDRWDAALASYEKALGEDGTELVYRMAIYRARARAAAGHVEHAIGLRSQGLLSEALSEIQTALRIDPGSTAARQELQRTQESVEREKLVEQRTGKPSPPAERGLTAAELSRRETAAQVGRMLPAAELRPLNSTPITLKLSSVSPRILFETIGKVAGINVLFDSEYQVAKNLSVELTNSTLLQALDYVALLTRSFWKPLSSNTIFVTNDNPNKRRDYEEQVTRTFYLNNVNTPQEVQEIVNAVRSVTDLQRVIPFNSQFAIVVRGEADRVALAAKVIEDLDKPRSEVLVDVLVMQASKTFSRNLAAAIASSGLNVPVSFAPRSKLQVDSTSTSSSSSTTTTTTSTSSSSSTTTAISLASLGHLASSDFSITLPGALLEAALSDAGTKILQAPQVRTVDNMKATLKIGERQPTASGSYSAGTSTTTVSALVNTQFTYIDVGVNVELTPRVHSNGEISMHVEMDISNVTGTVDMGGINEPIIGQRKVVHDIRVRAGEINLLGGLTDDEETKTITGIPGLSSIPVLRRLFTSDSLDRSRSDLMIVLIPHILRSPDLSPENLKSVAVGNSTVVKLNYAPNPASPDAPEPAGSPSAAEEAPPLPATAPREKQ